jgi:molecular chaperone GrpE (heat shock protein)
MGQAHAIDRVETAAEPATAGVRQSENLTERPRRIRQIEATIADLDRSANDLEREIDAEQKRTRLYDPAHYAYSTYAKSLIVRRDNLRRSSKDLHSELIRLTRLLIP